MSRNSPKTVVMALLTQMSIGPSASSTALAAGSTWSQIATSVGRDRARPPSLSTSRRAPSSPARPRASRATASPRRANSRATARPTPEVAPVTTTTRDPLTGPSYHALPARNGAAPGPPGSRRRSASRVSPRGGEHVGHRGVRPQVHPHAPPGAAGEDRGGHARGWRHCAQLAGGDAKGRVAHAGAGEELPGRPWVVVHVGGGEGHAAAQAPGRAGEQRQLGPARLAPRREGGDDRGFRAMPGKPGRERARPPAEADGRRADRIGRGGHGGAGRAAAAARRRASLALQGDDDRRGDEGRGGPQRDSDQELARAHASSLPARAGPKPRLEGRLAGRAPGRGRAWERRGI